MSSISPTIYLITNLFYYSCSFTTAETVTYSAISWSVSRSIRIAWHKLTPESKLSYQQLLSHKLHSVILPKDALTCHHADCHNHDHIADLNQPSSNIIAACMEAADAPLLHNVRRSDGTLPTYKILYLARMITLKNRTERNRFFGNHLELMW